MTYRKPSASHVLMSVPRHRGFGASDVGLKRKTNQDAFLIDDRLALYIVADGLGGHPAGDVASREAVDAVHGMVERGIGSISFMHAQLVDDDARAACRLLESAFQSAAYLVHSLAMLDPAKVGMGTTLSAVLLLGGYAVMAHVGDTRIYRFREGEVAVLTVDHNEWEWTHVPTGGRRRRQRVSRDIGRAEYADVDTGIFSIRGDDRILLCSDGLYTHLSVEDMRTALAFEGERAIQKMIDLSKQRGGSDNMTAILVQLD